MKNIRKVLLITGLVFILIFLANFIQGGIEVQATESQYCYLSDIKYIPGKSSVGWGSITLDKNLEAKYNDGLITLNIDGKKTQFLKGISAHATSTIVYDLTNYNYDYFTSYIGVDASRGNNGNGVKFSIYTSKDGENWDLQTPVSPPVMKGSSNAIFVKIDIKESNYLKLYAHNNGNAGSDHSVYANAKLIKEGYVENTNSADFIKTLEEYDEIIKGYDGQEITEDYELTLLQRELVSRVGYDMLSLYANHSVEYRQTISWLFNDVENLRTYILGGTPEGGYMASLKVLNELYQKYKEDFTITETTKYGTVLGDLYTRMAMAMSLTHSTSFGLWIQSGGENRSDAITRYQIYKDMHKNGNFVVLRNADGSPQLNENGTPKLDVTQWFENYNVEEMRYIFNNLSDDEETLWLNEYTQSFVDQYPSQYGRYLSPHPYMDYRTENLNQPEFYDPERKDEWDNHFKGVFSKYNVTYRPGLKKIWMFLRNPIVPTGAVCGGISKIGSSVRTSHGIPCVVIGQPGHAAMIYYWQNADGKGYWNLDNDVSGWTASEKGERLLLGWGNANSSYARGSHQVVYMLLAQEALNDYDNLVKAEELVYLAKSYEGDLSKQEEIYRKALEAQPINIDAWLGIINVYNSDKTKTENDYYNLAEDLAESLKCFPLPMYHLTNLIKPRLTSVENSYRFTLLQTRILTEGSTLPNSATDQVLQPSITRIEANFLLGNLDKTIATFSFDGDNSGKIILSSRFDGNGIRWDYSLDGKQTWNEVSFSAEEEHKLQLTQEQIETITAENDIYVHIVGVGYEEENLYKIDITNTNAPVLYNNDLENKIMGVTNIMEWRLDENDPWTSYKVSEPDLTGDKTVQVRIAPSGTGLASSITTLNFTQDQENAKRKYIKIEHLSIANVSSEATSNQGNASFAIDGNYNTRWHSNWNGSDSQKYITIKLDKPMVISAMDYVPAGGGNGRILQAKILGSMDGENFTEIQNVTWANNDVNKTVDFDDPIQVQYIKLIGSRTSSAGGGSFIAARMFNFYEDTTIKVVASFSFDGNNAGEIVLANEYKNSNWKYSIDSGLNWKTGNGDIHELTTEEINQINENDKIKIKFDGNETEYTINIKKGNIPDINPYINDWENRLIGINNVDTLEWKYEDTNDWTSYSEIEPIVEGNRKLLIRTKATGIYCASEIREYQFTEDTDSDTEKYVPIKHLSIHGYSTQSVDSSRPFYAPNAIDGNINTLWHTDFRYSVLTQEIKPFLTIKLDEPRYISALEFVQTKYREVDPDFIKNATVYVSMDGEDWTVAGRIENCPQNNELRKVEFTEDIFGQYVKFEMETYDIFASVAMINIYEDITKRETEPTIPTAEIEYNITEPTNQDVIATLVNPSTHITVTNNNGNTSYTFTKNGEFTFEFIDDEGNKGTAKAEVTWIDKSTGIEQPEIASEKYIIKENTITRILPETTLNSFRENIVTNREFTIVDKNGSAIANSEVVKSGMTLKFDGNIEFKLIVIGDINEDGRISTTDLAKLKLHMIGKEVLTGNALLAADVDGNGRVTITDLAQMKLIVVGAKEL